MGEGDYETHQSWKKPDQATLTDVAKEAGVSKSAASVVLNGARSGTRISAQRRQMVVEAAERMGYRPNALARSLITGRTNLVGVYSGRAHLDSRNAFFAELLGGVFEGTGEFGANTVAHSSGGGPERLLELVSNQIIDGLVVHAGSDDPIMRMIGEIRVPAVAVADVVEQLPSVVVDDSAGGRLQAQHLSMRGHRTVLMKNANAPTFSAITRLAAFEKEAAKLGIRCIDSFEGFGEEDGLTHQDIKLLSAAGSRITAIVAWSDGTAMRVCSKLDSLGISIPGEVAVVGFDGVRGIPPHKYTLTTIRADWAEVGRVAARTVKSLLDHASVPKITRLPVEFIRGTTT